MKKTFVELVARLSTVAFLGADLSRNAEWIELATNYTVGSFGASVKLNAYPSFLQRLANIVLPECRTLRATESQARAIIDAQLAERRRLKKEGKAGEYNDVLEWYEKQYQKLGGRYDPTSAQLVLSVAAIHTTTDLLSEVILELAQRRELVAALRQEIQEALGDGQGLTKSAVYNMKLLDSVIKETQRMKPAQVGEFAALLPSFVRVCQTS